MIFDIHRMMLEDDDYLEAINSEIKDGTNAEYAVEMAQNQFASYPSALICSISASRSRSPFLTS